jgi:hypothetical protein
MMALLTATGTRMLLAGDDRARFVIQAFAEAIGVLEVQIKGSKSKKEPLQVTVDPKSGVPKASKKDLIKFYLDRTPCECLDEMEEPTEDEQEESSEEDEEEEVSEEEESDLEEYEEEDEDEEEYGTCCFKECNAHKQLSQLSACAGCNVMTYCSVDCQRSDWPRHSKECQKLNLERQQREWAAQENAEDDESDYYSGSDDGSSYDSTQEDGSSGSGSSVEVKKSKKKKKKDKDKKKSKKSESKSKSSKKSKESKDEKKKKSRSSSKEKGEKKKKDKKSKDSKSKAIKA